MKRSFIFFALLLTPFVSFGQLSETTFDFWVGQWKLTWQDANGNTGEGENTIEKILDNKVLQEHFNATKGPYAGMKGTSISVFNPQQGTWHQTWQDNQGSNIVFTGRIEGKKKYFETAMTDNKQSRMVFYEFKDKGFTWDWEATQDGGKTWTLNWRINYSKVQ